MYRPGELVWFQRGAAWGLGVIIRRWGQPQISTDKHYLVQPLSHPTPPYPNKVIKSSELEMRPWIAWSVPKFTNEGLNNLSPPATYETIDWQALKNHRYGTGDLEVDGSILAAKMVDSSYTPFSQSRIERPSPGVTETHYEGLFLGAEKVWLGDPVRLNVGSGIDIMVVHSIIERQTTTSSSTLQFMGDVYTLTSIPHQNPSLPTPASPQNNPHLPIRLTEDLAYRNARSIHSRRVASYWKLAAPQSRVEINDVKGRWYEASLILPILQPQQFADASRRGEIQEAGLWMNGRGDCVNANRAQGMPKLEKVNRKVERREGAFGGSVPADTQILEGREPYVEGSQVKNEEEGDGDDDMVIDPRFDTADDGAGGGGEEKGFDELMNLDGIGEGMVGGGGGGEGGWAEGDHGGFSF